MEEKQKNSKVAIFMVCLLIGLIILGFVLTVFGIKKGFSNLSTKENIVVVHPQSSEIPNEPNAEEAIPVQEEELTQSDNNEQGEQFNAECKLMSLELRNLPLFKRIEKTTDQLLNFCIPTEGEREIFRFDSPKNEFTASGILVSDGFMVIHYTSKNRLSEYDFKTASEALFEAELYVNEKGIVTVAKRGDLYWIFNGQNDTLSDIKKVFINEDLNIKREYWGVFFNDKGKSYGSFVANNGKDDEFEKVSLFDFSNVTPTYCGIFKDGFVC